MAASVGIGKCRLTTYQGPPEPVCLTRNVTYFRSKSLERKKVVRQSKREREMADDERPEWSSPS